ncbi:YbjQ family protein [bacterium]|nr:YbjQ family protein [Candidatus Aenigmarchaeota archaeon]MCK4818572.1 YbjQ family protein [bacterium]
MIISTSQDVSGKKVTKTIGVVTGSTIRAKHLGKDIIAGLRNIVGGEIKEYTEMLIEARKEALQRMEENAKGMGADAVIGMRFTTSMVTSNAAEILAYGTAVKLG